MPRRDRAASSPALGLFGLAFKAVAVVFMVATPLLGVWVASSLAAFANRATWLPLAAGLLLFPILPLAWDGIGTLRARSRSKKRFLTFGDRIVLRTLALNLVFLVGLLALYPERAFVAISARGDWMLEGRHSPLAERARRTLTTASNALEWLYKAAHENPYRKKADAEEHHPTPQPAPSGSASVVPTSSVPVPPPVDTSLPMQASAPASRAYPAPATLHPAVVSMPAEAEASIESVGRYIAEHEPDPWQRVKALHDYVADRIAYDAAAYFAHQIPLEDADADAVFRSRKAVCAGYAALLERLGKVTGDEIAYVVGDARSRQSPMEAEGHAWNAARIDGQWYLLDATWNAGSTTPAGFTKKYSTEWLFTPASLFAITHFPDERKWQLLEHAIERAEFFRRPVLEPKFFEHGLELVNPDRSQIAVRGALEVTLNNPRGTWLMADFQPKSGGRSSNCNGNGHTSFHCEFPDPGTYDVHLYASRERYGTYEYAGSVEVNAQP